jgi:hypothetical protein
MHSGSATFMPQYLTIDIRNKLTNTDEHNVSTYIVDPLPRHRSRPRPCGIAVEPLLADTSCHEDS